MGLLIQQLARQAQSFVGRGRLQRTYDVLMATSLDVRGLTVELPTRAGWVRPVNDVSFALGEGETLGIVGESGSGKTMLLLALMGLESPGARRTGEAWLRSHGPWQRKRRRAAATQRKLIDAAPAEMRALRGRRIAMVFQEPMTALDPVERVGAQIEEAIRVHEPGSAARKSAAARLLFSSAPRFPIPRAARANIRTSFRAACGSAR